MMTFTFTEKDNPCYYEFKLYKKYYKYVEVITTHILDSNSKLIGKRAWLHPIKDGAIVMRNDNFSLLTPGAINFINRRLKLLAFH